VDLHSLFDDFFVNRFIEDVPSKGFMKASLEIAAQAPADAIISYIPI
jgi:hypothetical protein